MKEYELLEVRKNIFKHFSDFLRSFIIFDKLSIQILIHHSGFSLPPHAQAHYRSPIFIYNLAFKK